jgi:hypothetical protein
VIPYDDNLERVSAEIARRSGVSLFDDREALARWEDFATQVWAAHPTAHRAWWRRQGVRGVFRLEMHRRFAALDGPFDEFAFFDADTLVLSDLDPLFDRLSNGDFVVYDDQFKGPGHVFQLQSRRLATVFSSARLDAAIFCAGFFISRRGVLIPEVLERMLADLRGGDAEVLYPWGPDQSLLNYLVLKSGIRIHNEFLHAPAAAETCVTSPQFVQRDLVLYDGDVRLPYLHYIGIPAEAFNALCVGQNVQFRYRDLFLTYRYLHAVGQRPRVNGPPRPYYVRPSWLARARWRLGIAARSLA